MNYYRTFHISASHFNSRKAYETYWALRDSDGVLVLPTKGDLLLAFQEIHGHNFKIEVHAAGQLNREGWVVSDLDVEKIVMQWNNKNLSTLPEFTDGRIRATTENMVVMLTEKLKDKFDDISWSVKIHETPDVSASLFGWAHPKE
jgi:6-pyruvoyl-tetrahydropterin synthase